ANERGGKKFIHTLLYEIIFVVFLLVASYIILPGSRFPIYLHGFLWQDRTNETFFLGVLFLGSPPLAKPQNGALVLGPAAFALWRIQDPLSCLCLKPKPSFFAINTEDISKEGDLGDGSGLVTLPF
ncbi:hypothetical protein ACJX0J_017024, partial [Zea mays]